MFYKVLKAKNVGHKMKKKHLNEYHNLQPIKDNVYTELTENEFVNLGQNFERSDAIIDHQNLK